jgi:23S rRNA (guanosine2251-2'-O)-methyltransferase
LLYGRNGVREALRAGRRAFHTLYLAHGVKRSPVIRDILALAETSDVPLEQVDRHLLDQWLEGANHQGVMLRAGSYPYVEPEAMLARAASRDEPPFLLLLDRVQDPQNLGALFRAAEAFGVHGVILPRHRAAHITPAVVNASAGAVEHLLVADVTNLVQTMQGLKAQGVWIAGLEAREDALAPGDVDWRGPLAVVVGSEGFGLSRLVAETCDWLVQLPMRGRINSLNAAVAGSIILFWAMQAREGGAS